MYNETVVKNNPFNSFRPHQKEAILKIMEHLDNGVENILLDAPVGVGKSLIAYVLSKSIWDLNKKNSYILTSTKYLQDQYLNDFDDLVTCKGRSNFICNKNGSPCSVGSCKVMNYHCDGKAKTQADGELDFDYPEDEIETCPYWKQKVDAINAPVAILNYKYALTETAYVKHLKPRDVAIIDEAHNTEQEIMGFLEYNISPTQIKKDVGYNFKFIDSNTAVYEDPLYEIADLYLKKAKKESEKLTREAYIERSENLKRLSISFRDDADNWIAQKEDYSGNISFKPIQVRDYSKHYLLSMADQKIFMSGSFLKPDVFAEDLGLDSYELVEIPSVIPPENRPIIKEYIGSMSSRNIDNNINNMANKVLEIVKRHPDEKVLIHTYTYTVSRKLEEAINQTNDDHKWRFLFHGSKNREQKTREFKESNDPMILSSPFSYEGVDFKYDDARVQIIVKNPFPSLHSAQIRLRDVVSNYKWIFQERCKVLSQMYGRAIRAADDYAVTYLLDSNIESLLGDSSLITTYMWEGFIDSYHNKKIKILNENLLSKDKKKSYEVERAQERIILNDIKDGLDTLTKLRHAYKKLPGDSYKVVEPTFKRLISNKAITLI